MKVTLSPLGFVRAFTLSPPPMMLLARSFLVSLPPPARGDGERAFRKSFVLE